MMKNLKLNVKYYRELFNEIKDTDFEIEDYVESIYSFMKNEEDVIDVGTIFDYISSTYSFSDSVMQGNPNIELLHQQLGHALINREIYNYYRLHGPIRSGEFQEAGFDLLKVLALGRIDWAEVIFSSSKKLIKSGKFFDDGARENNLTEFPYPQRLGVFSQELMAQREGSSVDWEVAKITPVDNIYLFGAREGYYEEDPKKVDEWILALADAHIEHTSTTEGMGEEDELDGYEIVEEADHIWPFEIHALMRLRREKGRYIPDLKKLGHPLFQQPLATLYDMPLKPWKPVDIRIDQVLDKIGKDEPDLAYIKPLLLQKPLQI